MRFAATTVLLVSSAVAALVRCSGPGLASSPPQLHVGQQVSAETLAPLAPLETSEVEHRLLDRAWVAAGEDALAHPTTVKLPYAEAGGFLGSEPSARAFAFEGSEGQVVKIVLARSEAQGSPLFVDGNIRVELFLEQTQRGEQTHALLAELVTSEPSLWFRLPVTASYVVRLAPEPLTDALYRLSVELEAALPFPVKGRSEDAVRSLFGMPRDSGLRHHEGVDIFAPRYTPVVAVADGQATPRENQLGGNTVWLSTPGMSYYYAHLERATVSPGQRVRVGDVIGYVGNSGNAATTDPHLHFGIYRWGRGAVDPFPLLQARRFREPSRGLPDSRLVQASARRACRIAPRVHVHDVAAFGCAMQVGTASDAHASTIAGDCRDLLSTDGPVSPEARPESPRGSPLAPHLGSQRVVQWQTAQPLPVDDLPTTLAPVNFDPGPALEVSQAPDADGLHLTCELASMARAGALGAGVEQRLRARVF